MLKMGCNICGGIVEVLLITSGLQATGSSNPSLGSQDI
jgi:hypothetical protein